jgi:hypothetical protein
MTTGEKRLSLETLDASSLIYFNCNYSARKPFKTYVSYDFRGVLRHILNLSPKNLSLVFSDIPFRAIYNHIMTISDDIFG